MKGTGSFTVGCLVCVVAAGVAARQQAAGQQPPQQQRPTFNTAVTVVPVDVRVIDTKTNKPVTDLRQEDFSVFEDDQPQQIRLFERHALTADPLVKPGEPTKVTFTETPFTADRRTNRVFLLLFGRGRLQEPSKALDALLHFVRNQLLPQDQVAVFAYDRATDFTTDHEGIARFIERFKQLHYDINMDVALQTQTGLAAVYGSKSISKSLQTKIDRLFYDPALASHGVAQVTNQPIDRARGDSRQTFEALQKQDAKNVADAMAANLNLPRLNAWNFEDEIAANKFTDLGLDDFMASNAQTLRDLSSCYAGIEYLRHVQGEKHLVFVTEKGMALPRRDDDEALAKAASDARVAIDTFQTGGIEAQVGGQATSHFNEVFAFKALRNIAEWTGGVSAIAEPGMSVLDRLNDATLNGYVLGYYPSLAGFDGSYRKITVKVNRPNTQVLYRHGYFANRTARNFDRRSFVTRERMLSAMGFMGDIKDIKIELDASMKEEAGAFNVTAALTIDPSKLAVTVENGTHKGMIDVAVVCIDVKAETAAQYYKRVPISVPDDTWQKAQIPMKGLPFTVKIEAPTRVRTVRAIVYDYKADLIGSAHRSVQ